MSGPVIPPCLRPNPPHGAGFTSLFEVGGAHRCAPVRARAATAYRFGDTFHSSPLS